MTPEQVRAARAILQWSVRKLAAEAELSPNTIISAEKGRHPLMPSTLKSLHLAFSRLGFRFEKLEDSIAVHFARTGESA